MDDGCNNYFSIKYCFTWFVSPSTTKNFLFCSNVAEWEICAWPFLCLWWTWDLPKHTHKFILYIWMKTVIVIFLSNTVLHDLSAHQPPKTSYFVAMWLNEKSVHGHFFVSVMDLRYIKTYSQTRLVHMYVDCNTCLCGVSYFYLSWAQNIPNSSVLLLLLRFARIWLYVLIVNGVWYYLLLRRHILLLFMLKALLLE